MKPLTILIVGAGARGRTYATYALEHPEQAKVIAVAEPNDFSRESLVRQHGIPAHGVFHDYRPVLEMPRLADAAIIATQDAHHAEPTIALANKGYSILLEKPMAPNEADIQRIVETVAHAKVPLAVCHVLRYTPYTQALQQLLRRGAIGEVMHVQHLEPVGYFHMAHSYVRGNWRREDCASFMLLAQCCHDVDWISYIVGKPCRRVSSFGSLTHFHAANRPAGAADRCLDCPAAVESNCCYSALKIYLHRAKSGQFGWPVDIITKDLTVTGVTQALTSGPYGRCVYACDNDVVDNQVVNMEFAGGATASLSMIGCTEMTDRRTRIFGTRGEIEGNGATLKVVDFLTDQTRIIDTTPATPPATSLWSGDYGLMSRFIQAAASGDSSLILSGPWETLESHRIVFAAERARREHSVVSLPPSSVPKVNTCVCERS